MKHDVLNIWKNRIIHHHNTYLKKCNLDKSSKKEKKEESNCQIKIFQLKEKQEKLQSNITMQKNILNEKLILLFRQRQILKNMRENDDKYSDKYCDKYCDKYSDKKSDKKSDKYSDKFSDKNSKIKEDYIQLSNTIRSNKLKRDKLQTKLKSISKLFNHDANNLNFPTITISKTWTSVTKLLISKQLRLSNKYFSLREPHAYLMQLGLKKFEIRKKSYKKINSKKKYLK